MVFQVVMYECVCAHVCANTFHVLKLGRLGINYLMAISTQPQASWSLRTDNVNPCDTALLPYHQPEMHKLITYSVTLPPTPLPAPTPLVPSWLLQVLLKPLGHPEGWNGEGGGRGVQDGEHMYTRG